MRAETALFTDATVSLSLVVSHIVCVSVCAGRGIQATGWPGPVPGGPPAPVPQTEPRDAVPLPQTAGNPMTSQWVRGATFRRGVRVY